MASWLWGGSGPGESVDTILLRFHSARQDDDIDEYLQELCKASKVNVCIRVDQGSIR